MKVRLEDKTFFPSKVGSIFISEFFLNKIFSLFGFKMKQVFLPRDYNIFFYFRLEGLRAICKFIFEDS